MAEFWEAAFWFFMVWFFLLSSVAVAGFLGSIRLMSSRAYPIRVIVRFMLGVIGGVAYASTIFILMECVASWKQGIDLAVTFGDWQKFSNDWKKGIFDGPPLITFIVAAALLGAAIRSLLDWRGRAT